MVLKNIQSVIFKKLTEIHPGPSQPLQFFSVGGGSINETYRLAFKDQQYFCKINSSSKFPQLFEKEMHGLELIRNQGIIKTPDIIGHFVTGNHQLLLLNWVSQGEKTKSFWQKFGQQLARLHDMTQENFGLYEENYMGSITQTNTRNINWVEFFIQQRLQPMVSRCVKINVLTAQHLDSFEKLYDILPAVFSENRKPALVHGDLWNGNFMCDQNSEPVLIDPAVYYGHPAVDLGMTALFGGFDPAFYEAYRYHTSLPTNHQQQCHICNLYPLLIHLFLFGRGYLPQIEFNLLQSLHAR